MSFTNVTADGGIQKRIITEGAGDSPTQGSSVRAHYVGTLLTGDVFDSSRAKNKEFVFPIGVGRVIKGWDVGIATMKVGEKCVLRCKPEYAYGSRAAGPIPPNSTLDFEVELLGFQ